MEAKPEPTCRLNCIAGVLVNDDYETGDCPDHDGILVDGTPTRIPKRRRPIQRERRS